MFVNFIRGYKFLFSEFLIEGGKIKKIKKIKTDFTNDEIEVDVELDLFKLEEVDIEELIKKYNLY